MDTNVEQPPFNIIEGEECFEEDDLGCPVGYNEANLELEEDEKEAEISVCVVLGGEGMNTIKLERRVNKTKLIILVDSGSIHNFIDPQLVSQLRREPEKNYTAKRDSG